MDKIRILLADDHPLVRQALRNIIEKEADLEIVDEVGNGREAIEQAIELKPDVVIMDISMPEVNGIEATKAIKAQCKDIAILVLTVHTDYEHVFNILHAGAIGYITKSAFGPEIIHGIRAICAGETVLSSAVSLEMIEHSSQYGTKEKHASAGRLTAKETRVLQLASEGMSNKAIAAELGITLRTTKGYLTNIFMKLGARSRTQAISIALKQGLIDIG